LIALSAVAICHTGTVLNHPVRFVAADGQTGGLAWVVLDDLLTALRAPEHQRDWAFRTFRAADDTARTVAIDGQITVLTAEPSVRTALGILKKNNEIPELAVFDYLREVVAAAKVSRTHISPAEVDSFAHFVRSQFTGATSRLVAVSPEAVASFWPGVEHFVSQACRKGPENELPERLREGCENGRYLLWVVEDDGASIGAMITGFLNEHDRRVGIWLAVGGVNFAVLERHRVTIETVAKAHGCVAMRSYSRPGMRKRMKSYRVAGLIMEKAL